MLLVCHFVVANDIVCTEFSSICDFRIPSVDLSGLEAQNLAFFEKEYPGTLPGYSSDRAIVMF